MVADVPRSTKWKVRVTAFGGLLAGLTFLAIPPLVDWSLVLPLRIFGLPLAGVFGYMIGYGLIFRLRHPDPAERAAARDRVLDTGPGASPHARSFFARQATPAATGTLAPGRELVVKVDPEDPQRAAVNWERSLPLSK